ncbi:MAG: S1 RNA-binding domain-containing protein [Ruminococcus sp.]|nr:S1 RNA-binding domain-containing protein [Ruminococcus sp.]
MRDFLPEGCLMDTQDNSVCMESISSLCEAYREQRILEARATVCDANHNLTVDLGCIRGIIPRKEGALGIREGRVRDIAVISRVNRPVSFVITGFDRDESGATVATLSRELAQKRCMDDYVSTLRVGDVVDARITHLETFGAFADIGCGIVALLPIDAISVSRIEHPCERFTVGMDIKAIIKSIENGRISLSHKELLGTWQENADNFRAGETVAGIIRSIENYGAFVELSPNLAGLAESKDSVRVGQQASVYIKSINPEKMKVKLIIVETFDYKYSPQKPKYFFEGEHMDEFLYSPANCEKRIVSTFS